MAAPSHRSCSTPGCTAWAQYQGHCAQHADFPLCQHCHAGRAYRPRGLCDMCYTDTSIRYQYPYRSRARGAGDTDDPVPLPAEPTDTLPGTTERLKLMHERYKKRVSLFHPNDAQRSAT